MNKKILPSTPSDLQKLALSALSDLTPLFLEHTASDIQFMLSALDSARSASATKRYTLIRDDFFRKAHDMKGEGSTFDYPLLTFLGTVMCDYLRPKTSISKTDLDFLSACMTDVKTVFDQKITGENNAFSKTLHQKWGKNG